LARRSRQSEAAAEGGKEADGATASKPPAQGERLDTGNAAANMEGVIRSQWIVKANTLREVIDLVDNMIETIPTENPYANCKSFDEVCKVFIEEDHQMRKFFGKDKAMKTWTLKREVFVRGSQRLVEYKVVDENGKPVCARNNQRDAVVSALRIASETGRGAVQVVGE
jgi:hypothetical protein